MEFIHIGAGGAGGAGGVGEAGTRPTNDNYRDFGGQQRGTGKLK